MPKFSQVANEKREWKSGFKNLNLVVRIDSRADWCKNTVVCDETMIFGMITCHAITNSFLYRAIRCQLHQNCQGSFYALLLKFSCKGKFFKLNNYF